MNSLTLKRLIAGGIIIIVALVIINIILRIVWTLVPIAILVIAVYILYRAFAKRR
jgi:hypothetical protein